MITRSMTPDPDYPGRQIARVVDVRGNPWHCVVMDDGNSFIARPVPHNGDAYACGMFKAANVDALAPRHPNA